MKKTILAIAAFVSLHAAHSQTVGTLGGTPGTPGWTIGSISLATAKFTEPFGIVVDDNDRIFISESGETHRVRVIDMGSFTVYNKTGHSGDPSDAGVASYINGGGNAARYNSPRGMVIGPDGKLYVCDFNNHVIRVMNGLSFVTQLQGVSTFVGEDEGGSLTGDLVDGTGNAARFDSPIDICVDGNGNFYVADNYNECIRKITPGGTVTTLAGSKGMVGDVDATGSNARFNNILAIEMLDANHLIVADAWNNKIRKVNINTGEVTTYAGTGATGNKDDVVALAEFNGPCGLAVDAFGNVYVSEDGSGQSNVIRRISNGQVVTICGAYQDATQHANGQGTNSRFYRPAHMAFNTTKDVLYVCDYGNHVIRKIEFKPKARFFANPTNTNVGVTVQITNQSVNDPVSHSWQITPNTGFTYENATTSSSIQPTLKFNQTGTYTIQLTVTNAFGSNDTTRHNYINISNVSSNDPPVADFVANDSTIAVGGIVLFDDLSTNQPSQWAWTITPSTFQYVNSTASNSENPEVQFTAIANYTVTLDATNTNGTGSKTKTAYIQVGPLGIKNLSLNDVLEVYPNPANGNFQLRLKDNMVSNGLQADLYDMNGKCIDSRMLEGDKLSYAGLSSGIYLIRVSDGENTYQQKVVVR